MKIVIQIFVTFFLKENVNYKNRSVCYININLQKSRAFMSNSIMREQGLLPYFFVVLHGHAEVRFSLFSPQQEHPRLSNYSRRHSCLGEEIFF